MSPSLRLAILAMVAGFGFGVLIAVLVIPQPSPGAAVLLAPCQGTPTLLLFDSKGRMAEHYITQPDTKFNHLLELLPPTARHTVKLPCMNPMLFQETEDEHPAEDHAPARF